MNIPTLFLISLVATGAAPQSTVPRGGGPTTPSVGSVSPLAFSCAPSIRDQATGACLQASSDPAFGMLLPYPGVDNLFTPPAFVGGGQGNDASGAFSTVGAGRYNAASALLATTGGGFGNAASGPFAVAAGGFSNIASGYDATIGGGRANTVRGGAGTVGGGRLNTASGSYATIGGGGRNTASAFEATVAGGDNNTASGLFATVGGGFYNTASGSQSVVPGGSESFALGTYSFAAGRRAQANHDGAFVWADGQNVDKPSSAPNEFNVYCSGGARLFTNSAATTGVLLAPGSGSWSAVSDRDSKENIEPVDGRAVLEELIALPLATWSYKAQDDSIRHMGPMAQDFHAAFGLGVSDELIDTIDPDGVALAAIQGLNAELQERLAEKDAEIEELRDRLERVEASLAGE